MLHHVGPDCCQGCLTTCLPERQQQQLVCLCSACFYLKLLWLMFGMAEGAATPCHLCEWEKAPQQWALGSEAESILQQTDIICDAALAGGLLTEDQAFNSGLLAKEADTMVSADGKPWQPITQLTTDDEVGAASEIICGNTLGERSDEEAERDFQTTIDASPAMRQCPLECHKLPCAARVRRLSCAE
jgi:hypothetical protein